MNELDARADLRSHLHIKQTAYRPNYRRPVYLYGEYDWVILTVIHDLVQIMCFPFSLKGEVDLHICKENHK